METLQEEKQEASRSKESLQESSQESLRASFQESADDGSRLFADSSISIISEKDEYYDEENRETASAEELEESTTAEDFDILKTFGSIVLPNDCDVLFADLSAEFPKDLTGADFESHDSGSSLYSQDGDVFKVDTSPCEFGSIVLNELAFANIMNNHTPDKQNQDDLTHALTNTLAHALEPDAYGAFSESQNKGELILYSGKSRKRKINPYMSSTSEDDSLMDRLSHLALPVESFEVINLAGLLGTELGADGGIDVGIDGVENSVFPQNTQSQVRTEKAMSTESSFPEHMLPMLGDLNSICIDHILQAPQRFWEGAVPSAVPGVVPSAMPGAMKEGCAPLDSPLDSSLDLSLDSSFGSFLDAENSHSIKEDCLLKTDFFELYFEKGNAKNNTMWDSSYDARDMGESITYAENNDFWATFDMETDWIDISFSLGKEFTFEVINDEADSVIVIKNGSGHLIQGLTVLTTKLDDALVYGMQEHIKNPLLGDILSLGARFGIFSISDNEPWFSSLRERPDATSFLRSQQVLEQIHKRQEALLPPPVIEKIKEHEESYNAQRCLVGSRYEHLQARSMERILEKRKTHFSSE